MPKTAAELREEFKTCESPDVPGLLEQALELANTLTIERDAARANARILAHSYITDGCPPDCVVTAALECPVDPSVTGKEI